MESLRPAACVAIAVACVSISTRTRAACLESGAQLQILGSGGPAANLEARASSSYVVWIDGLSRIMVDSGSGTKDQFHAARARLEDIGLIALSHFHPDHSAELPALLWGATPRGVYRTRLSGPTGGDSVPSVSEFLDRLFGQNGAFPMLGERVEFDVLSVDTASRDVVAVWSVDGIRVSGMGVPHATVPTVGYRVDIGDASVAFASDQNGSYPSFIDFIRGVDVLVIHMTIGEEASGFPLTAHAKPSGWGQMATAGEVGQIVLGHISAPTPEAFQAQLKVLRANYAGPVIVGEDLLCVELN